MKLCLQCKGLLALQTISLFLVSLFTITNVIVSRHLKILDLQNKDGYRVQGCREVLDSLHADGRLVGVYYEDAKHWCHDRFERGE